MRHPVAHGAIVLAISLATLGAIVSAEEGPAAGSSAGGRALLRSETFVPTVAGPGVPIRNGRINAQAATAAAEVMPVSVRVGSISLRAPVVAVGVDEDNQLDVPSADSVGWYRYGARPGESGASVLAAHVDYNGSIGAFYHLSQVVTGDRVEVELEDGSVLGFRVTHVYEIDKSELPAEELFRKDGAPVLQLITCGGTFDPQRRSYVANLVVTAEPITGPGSA